jgi:hypothetical protein
MSSIGEELPDYVLVGGSQSTKEKMGRAIVIHSAAAVCVNLLNGILSKGMCIRDTSNYKEQV